MHRTIRVTVAATLLALAATVLPAPMATAGRCTARAGMEYVTPVTLHVAIGRFKKTYRVGNTVKVKVTVTRPAEQDPAGLGIGFERPVGQPAADVNVGVGLSIGRVFLPGYGRTNAQGKTTVAIKLARYVRGGVAQVRAFAYKEVVNTTCLTVEEQGYHSVAKAFRVKR